jgi:hypothetical protein
MVIPERLIMRLIFSRFIAINKSADESKIDKALTSRSVNKFKPVNFAIIQETLG